MDWLKKAWEGDGDRVEETWTPERVLTISNHSRDLVLVTASGRVPYNTLDQVPANLLEGAHAMIEVIDSQPSMIELTNWCRERLETAYANLEMPSLPTVHQLNKRDQPGILSVAELIETYALHGQLLFASVAYSGLGVAEALEAAMRLAGWPGDVVPGQILWTGRADEKQWTVSFVEVLKADDPGEPDEHGLVTSTDPVWVLRFEDDVGDSFLGHWDPKVKGLYPQLHGWGRGAVHVLRSELIRISDAG